ncbi:putative ferric-chelate reductase 1 [Rhinatrema bivittatum]|uniref:putative ferric-chelate reductase 1 n=1 Tax=Rhinatrema bivittatum TaxID=194408 RepID=UPI001127A282|nr:putative ferric-chelate reductase 1 [Rhinatrema bivittatum]XP_029474077.1 putative ferric-chelate reductase 1 [Rhinatrema bivittatum]XP_029474078.1 putative ferric-chelate reductase 1 [Rhinatrema bivittatum]XP_029474079.1 putative ferric-chelate reductase 1 [Rhinatrema bivittatum]XP_029474080.1 putative ferric-chelate reductase 1 [Rhinatrema bivittatum]
MELCEIALVISALSLVCVPVAGFENGKVTQACSSMRPGHGHHASTPPHHNVSVDKTEFGPGDRIKVTVAGPRFEGFFIQARDAENLDGDAVGSFTLISAGISQLLTCGDVEDSAVSHTSKSRKTEVEAYWHASSSAPKHVQFLVTVVEKYKTFSVKIPGPIVSQPGAPPLTTHSPTARSPSTSSPASHLTKRFNATGCGSTRFCVRSPLSCDPETDARCFFLSFTREEHSVLAEMSGPGEGYVAFAFSHDQWMGDDDAYLCVAEDQRIRITPAFLAGRSYPELDSEAALQDLAWRLADGVMQCSFRRNLRLPAYKRRFDLDAAYYIFLADGESNDGLLSRHNHQPLITSRKFDITASPEDIGGSRSPLIIKVHGILMFVAWMTTVSIGVLVARFFKPVWPNSKLFGEKVWFQVHRILMIATVAITSIAFVLPFVYRGGWSRRAGFHPYLGCIVMTLAFLQPVFAVFRPSPHAPRRPLFNWFHWITGTAARIIAVAAMFLGMDVQALNLPDPWDTYTLIGFVLWHVGIDVLLELHSYCLIRKAERMEEDSVAILHSVSAVETKGLTFKKVVLTVYICGNVAFLVTFLAAINQI